MKSKVMLRRSRSFKNSNRRRVMVKKIHNRVLLRRKQFLFEDDEALLQQAC